MNQGEIVIYKTNDKADFQLEVRIEEETVWLTQAQMLNLFDSTKQNISLHINNIFKEGELDQNAVVKEYLTTASDGKKYKTKYYNLDVIISIGYRVKLLQGFLSESETIEKRVFVVNYLLQCSLPVLADFKEREVSAHALRYFSGKQLKAANKVC